MDGTLLDTLADLGNSLNRVLSRLGLPVHPIPAYKQLVGEGITVLVRKALPEPKRSDGALIARCVVLMSEEYSAHWADQTRVYSGIIDLLEELTHRKKTLAVLSNKPDEMVQALVQKYFPSISFHAVFGAREGLPRKPDPAGALEIARTLAIAPERFVFLGDSKTDMETAVAANMYPVGALWGFRDERELLDHGAKALINLPKELLGIGM